MPEQRRVVVTGLGAVTPVGNSAPATWTSLIAGCSGIAPITKRSGKSCWVHWRWACPKFVRQSFHEYAAQSIRWSGWARAFYDLQRQRGKGHHAAVRSLAYRWIRIIYRCWQQRTPYCEATYCEALVRRKSPLAQILLAQTAE